MAKYFIHWSELESLADSPFTPRVKSVVYKDGSRRDMEPSEEFIPILPETLRNVAYTWRSSAQQYREILDMLSHALNDDDEWANHKKAVATLGRAR